MRSEACSAASCLNVLELTKSELQGASKELKAQECLAPGTSDVFEVNNFDEGQGCLCRTMMRMVTMSRPGSRS